MCLGARQRVSPSLAGCAASDMEVAAFYWLFINTSTLSFQSILEKTSHSLSPILPFISPISETVHSLVSLSDMAAQEPQLDGSLSEQLRRLDGIYQQAFIPPKTL
jgi:hypothetical protein